MQIKVGDVIRQSGWKDIPKYHYPVLEILEHDYRVWATCSNLETSYPKRMDWVIVKAAKTYRHSPLPARALTSWPTGHMAVAKLLNELDNQ